MSEAILDVNRRRIYDSHTEYAKRTCFSNSGQGVFDHCAYTIEEKNQDYNRQYALDESQLFLFLEDTQAESLEKLKRNL